jgi:uncharacterized membrane protein YdjX (TVP38/TMEM64 family)
VTRNAALVRLGLLGAAVTVLFTAVALTGAIAPSRVQEDIEPFGVAAPIVFVLVSSLLTVALFPGPLLAAASGLLFGTGLGTAVSIVSATLGALLAFSIARYVARDATAALAGRRLLAVQAWIGERGFVAVLYARIMPGLPYTVVNYVAGLAPIRIAAFGAATAIGVAPRAYAYTALGGNLGDLRSPEVVVAAVLLVVMSVGGLLLARRDRAARRALV